MQLGWCDEDKASITHAPKTKRQRERLTMDGFRAIRAVADPWLQHAMDVALITLQRREELCAMRFDAIVDGKLPVIQHKTGRRLMIDAGGELGATLAAIRGDNLACPFVVRRRPYRIKAREDWSDDRDHAFQVLPEQLTTEFRKARDETDFYKGAHNPPSLHEIRSLGADRYRQNGWPEATIQALLGHEDVAMTRHYLDGHERPWEHVSCGLDASE